MTGEDSELELYPSERNDAVILWADLQRKYGEKSNTKENLIQLANEAEDRFKKEIGLLVEVDVSNMEQANNGDLVLSPIINILDRVEKQDFDFERAQFEHKQGYFDGKPGVITEDGRWKEPDKKM